jgi:hypothetical protein
MGFNTPYIVGNTLNRDHQHWPTVSPALATTILSQGNLLEPFQTGERPACTLAQILALVWRVKEWHFSGTWSASGHDGFGSQTFSSTIDNSIQSKAIFKTAYPEELGGVSATIHDVVFEPFLASEGLFSSILSPTSVHYYLTDYAVPRRNYGLISPVAGPIQPVSYLKTTRSPGGAGKAFFFLFGDARFDDPFTPGPIGANPRGLDIVTFAADVFGPMLVFHESATAGTIIFTCQTPFSPLVSNATLTVVPGAAVAATFTAPLIISVGTPAILDSHTSSLTMTAAKFWPYQNSLGQPVYDETTGDQINDNV